MTKKILTALDLLALSAICIISYLALILQIIDSELPCALCVMQRMGFYAISFGLILNLCQERDTKHYMLIILAALLTSFMGLIQVLLHIVPGTGGYGDPVFGMHMYTWTFVLCMLFIFYAIIAGLLTPKTQNIQNNAPIPNSIKIISSVLIISLILNIISAFFECGPYLCPSDPQSYWLLNLL